VLGAQKAGTTTLHHWLARQPSLALPRAKETHFFSHDDRYSQSLDWYLRQFPESGPDGIRGEVDPEYLFFPQAALRMAQLGLRPRFVVVVRDPLARAYSHYRMSMLRGIEELSFPAALLAEEGRLAQASALSVNHHSYMARGRYTDQIRRIRGVFPDSPLLVVGFEELFRGDACSSAFGRICRFIGLEHPCLLPASGKANNPARTARWRFLNELIWDKSSGTLLRRLLRIAVPSRRARGILARGIYALNQRPAAQETDWLAGVADRFIRQGNEEARRVGEAFGVDTSSWVRMQDEAR
jgi:hypothetical protein